MTCSRIMSRFALGRMSFLRVTSSTLGIETLLTSRLPTEPYLGLARLKVMRTISSQNSKSSRVVLPPDLRLSYSSSSLNQPAITVLAFDWSDCSMSTWMRAIVHEQIGPSLTARPQSSAKLVASELLQHEGALGRGAHANAL